MIRVWIVAPGDLRHLAPVTGSGHMPMSALLWPQTLVRGALNAWPLWERPGGRCSPDGRSRDGGVRWSRRPVHVCVAMDLGVLTLIWWLRTAREADRRPVEEVVPA
ncbi:hypothetical protein [Herbidospora sp. NBRC 101105]|uniref:hypothetical protein n=1 Tax=Herbidospora sp. NBRC 101105 TaxID=3032195 RepID=UPI0024A1E06C|nr:hypothetical protein [Herbidospora sp. NBRC 101105]GLX97811.1 hypothetical protein Hesp01_57610 [Herbidospora sp. NBRC 101105]